MNPIKATDRYLEAWTSYGKFNEELMSSVLAEDVVLYQPVGEVKGRTAALEFMKAFHHSFCPFYFVCDGSTLTKDGGVATVWSATGKFVNDFKESKAHHGWIHFGKTSSTYYFNDKGQLTKSYDFWSAIEFQKQISYSLPPRDKVLKDMWDYKNGKLPSNYIRRHFHQDARINTPLAKNVNLDKAIEVFEMLKASTSELSYEWEASPSAQSFDRWICSFTLRAKVDRPNSLNLPVGKSHQFNGVATVLFNEQDLIVEETSNYDVTNFFK